MRGRPARCRLAALPQGAGQEAHPGGAVERDCFFAALSCWSASSRGRCRKRAPRVRCAPRCSRRGRPRKLQPSRPPPAGCRAEASLPALPCESLPVCAAAGADWACARPCCTACTPRAGKGELPPARRRTALLGAGQRHVRPGPPPPRPPHPPPTHLQGKGAALECEVRAGQMLYLPAGWFHEVTSFSTAASPTHVALNYWWAAPGGGLGWEWGWGATPGSGWSVGGCHVALHFWCAGPGWDGV